MQLQGGACAYNLSASCKNSSARSQAKGVPQAVGSYLFALPAVPYSLFLPSEKFTMASRMYVVKRGKPHLKHCVPEAVFLAGLAAMRQQAMFSCYLCVLFSDTDGRKETVMFDKITSRISKLCYGLNPDFVDPVRFLSSQKRLGPRLFLTLHGTSDVFQLL